MTIVQFLREIRSDPDDPLSPLLIVGERDLTNAQEAEANSATYGGRPYAVVEYVNDTPSPLWHRRQSIDVTLLQSSDEWGGASDAALMRRVLKYVHYAPRYVDEVEADGIMVRSSLILQIEIPPALVSYEAFSGLRSTSRFTAEYWRPLR